jgi:peptide/nickel transport system substrate-binding protein
MLRLRWVWCGTGCRSCGWASRRGRKGWWCVISQWWRRRLLCILLVLLAYGCASCAKPPPPPTPAPTAVPEVFEQKSLLASVEAVDSHTVRFILSRPDVTFLHKLAFPAFGIQSPANVKRYDGGGDLVRNPVGTGPFKFVEWVQDDHITLERNDDYWGERSTLQTLTYRVIKEAPARFLELQAGAVDGIQDLAPDDIAAAQADPNVEVYLRPPFNTGYLGINRARAPFDDLRVRQAVAMAVHKAEIVQALYPPTAEAATQFVPPGILGHTDGLEDWPHDPERVKALLAEAGYPDGFQTTLWVMPVSRGYYPNPDRVGEAIQANLAAVGIEAEIVTYDWGTYLDKVFAGQADLFLLGWMADYPDATNFLDNFFGAGSDDSLGPKFPELVQMLQEASSIVDQGRRQALYDQANQIIHDQIPAVPIVHNSSAIAFSKDVRGIKPSPLNLEFFWPVSVLGQDRLILARSADSVGLDPVDESDLESVMVCAQILEPLVTFAPGTTEIVPGLAERWEVSDDLLTWTFYLRRGIKFHDGTELDAEAVVFSFQRWWDRENAYHVGHTGSFFHWSFYFGGFKGE